MPNIWLHRYSVLLAVCTLFLVAAGASVTSTDSGLAGFDETIELLPLRAGSASPAACGDAVPPQCSRST